MGSSAIDVAKHREHLKQLINRTINIYPQKNFYERRKYDPYCRFCG